MTRILLGILGSNGDCLYATAIARQIKQDFPGCELTWAISTLSRAVLANNPDVDHVWEITLESFADMARCWTLFEAEAHRLAEAGMFDHVFLPQLHPAGLGNYDGTIRPSIFRNFSRAITAPVDVTIALDEAERAAADAWFAGTPAADAAQVVLFECSSRSGQSFMDVGQALALAEAITVERRHAVVIVATQDWVTTDNPRIVSGSPLSIRQTARLTNQADLFIGCGSGVTVAATSGAAKPGLPNIQILRRHTSVYASFRHDFAYFGKQAGHFMELTSEDPADLQRAVLTALCDGFPAAQAQYDDPVPLTFDWYIEVITTMLIDTGRYVEAAQSLLVTAGRYGWNAQLQRFARQFVLPFLADDPRANLPHRRAEAAALREAVHMPQRQTCIPAEGWMA